MVRWAMRQALEADAAMLLHTESLSGRRRMLRPYRRVVDPAVHRFSERMPTKGHPFRSDDVR